VPARALSAELCKRFDVRADDDPRFTHQAKYQGIPVDGYAALMRRILAGIPLHLGVDFLERRADLPPARTLIFTGPIDEFFGFDLGRLAYRGQRREHTYLPDVDRLLPCAQVNNPTHAGGPFLRTLEWKQMMPAEAAARVRGTVLTRETPHTPSDPSEYEYPFPDATNAAPYARYQRRLRHVRDIFVCGRLGEYRYFDMDQAIGRAQMIAERLLDGRPLPEILGSRVANEEGSSPPLRGDGLTARTRSGRVDGTTRRSPAS
jgi:UDP-galactopyranose mutase